ncbi:hypothetical protein HNQ94_003906 [Salirhabdus euzebyi]|uniref:Uncharacterized protein n=1 Tax=Salirhabdus euzebyi TaxID=394506 RepID=A0A841QAI1_9BACI|nr:hypothetical protein [Salirhabdus euzebyi]
MMAERMVGKQAHRFEMEAVLPNKEFGKAMRKLLQYRRTLYIPI